MNETLVSTTDCEQHHKMQADAIMEFVNLMIGALESGFVDKNNPTLAEIYQVARDYIKDTYNIDVPDIISVWGDRTAIDCGIAFKRVVEEK